MDAHRLTRRAMLRLCGAAGSLKLLRGTAVMGKDLVAAKVAVDHLLFGVADLERGIAWVERMTGVRPVLGGSHPGVGTRNALISLGNRQYLELIGPDPLQAAYNHPIDVRVFPVPRLLTWAAAAGDIALSAKNAREAGYQLFGPRDGSRARPDGSLLRWKSLGVVNKLGSGGVEPIPFFIQWAADSLHPSEDSPRGCELLTFKFEHPDRADVISALKRLGIEGKVKQASTARLIATLKTPKGRVELS